MARVDPRNVTQYWWDRHVSGLSLLHADFTTHVYPPHSHDAFVIAITETGGSIVKSRGVVDEAHSARLLVFNPAEPHAGWMGRSQRWRYRSLYLERAAIAEVARGLGITEVPYFTGNIFADADLIEGFLALHRTLEAGRDVFAERELLISTFGTLFTRHGSGGGRVEPAPNDNARLRRAVAVMRARHAEPLRLEDVADEVDLSIYQLIGLFKRTAGLPPHAYLTQLRLDVACHDLRRGLPLADVAPSAGFYDQSALNRHFKRVYGITPLQFARAARH